VLDALLRHLKPGGWLVIEEPDFGTARAVSGPAALAQGFDRVNRAISSMFSSRGMDPRLGRSLGALLEARSVELASCECEAHLVHGGSPLARMMDLSTRQLADKYVATECASRDDIDCYAAFAADAACWGVYYSTFRLLGRK
jgi:hypothetical protein